MMRDFNAKNGRNNNNDNSNVGGFDSGQRNSRDVLVNYCKSENLYWLNSFCEKP